MTGFCWKETTARRVPDARPGAEYRARPDAVGRHRGSLVIGLLSALIWLPGCSVWQLAHRTMYSELRDYPQVTDGKLACRQYQRWAKDEWTQVVQESGGGFSSDYGSGFIQGFVDQVYAGGKAQAPAIPPRKYWRIGYRNARGERAVEDWYAGFRHGARIAREGGYREQSVIPSSLRAAYVEEAEPLFASESDSPVIEEGELLEPTPAESIPEPEDLESAPPRPVPVPAEPILLEPSTDPLDDSASVPTPTEQAAPQITSLTGSNERAALDVRTRSDERLNTAVSLPSDAEPASPVVPYTEDPEGPPVPPWHRPNLAGPDPSPEVGSGVVVPASFDPFGGTPFQETLGLNPPDPVAPTGRQMSGARTERIVPAEKPTPAEEPADAPPGTGPRFTEAADPMNDAWQPPPSPPSTWKSRN